MLDFPSLDMGHAIMSAFFMAFTAFTVSKSGSPGPQPIQINSDMKKFGFVPN